MDFGDLEQHDFGPVVIAPERRAGIALDVAHRRRQRWERENRRPAALTAREGLAAVAFEARFVWVCAANLRNGTLLANDDFDRLTIAVRSIDLICNEAGL
jgi:hypothetical protein